jgi:DNA-binding GntR family transcriptional regulator
MPRTPSALARIVAALEEDILFGRLRTRERLIEDELIERFGATRHVVRQALVELERGGMVVRQRNRGAVVRDFTREEVDQICAVRELLHAHAAASIPLPAPPALLRRLASLQREHAQQVERGTPAGIHRVNNLFHETLFDACGNRYLAATIRDYAKMSLAFRCHLMLDPAHARNARDEHAAMIDALERGDRERLVALCVGHTRPARDVYLAMQGLDLSRLPPPRTPPPPAPAPPGARPPVSRTADRGAARRRSA